MEKLPSTRVIQDASLLLDSLGPLPEPGEKPVFIALSGLPGTGKSYFTKKLTEQIPLVVLESDKLRKTLFPRPSYSWRESARSFRACYYLIEFLLQKRVSLILDATNLAERYRQKLYAIVDRTRAQFILVKLEAPPELIRQRLMERKQEPANQSEADWSVYQEMKPREEKIKREHLTVNTSRPIGPAVNKIISDIKNKRRLNGN
jgi:predicted kinase